MATHLKLLFSGLLFLTITGPAFADSPKFNFGSMQVTDSIAILPGSSATTRIYFYNLFGNRITHITLSIDEVPLDWQVTISPSIHETTLLVNGFEVKVNETLYVEPSEPVSTKPLIYPQYTDYINAPSIDGFIEAKYVVITIIPPEGVTIGTSVEFTVDAMAQWFGDTAEVDVTQARSFDYTVSIKTNEYSEMIVGDFNPAVVVPFTIGSLIAIGALGFNFRIKRRRRRLI